MIITGKKCEQSKIGKAILKAVCVLLLRLTEVGGGTDAAAACVCVCIHIEIGFARRSFAEYVFVARVSEKGSIQVCAVD